MARVSGMWVGARLSALERACIVSFLARGHEFDLYAYDDIAEVPAGCRMLDAQSILPRECIFRQAQGEGQGSVGTFSDRFRYQLLYAHGGWWVDLDVFCLSAQLPQTEIVFARQDDTYINGAVLHVPPKHDLMASAYMAAAASDDRTVWGEMGPVLLTRLIGAQGLAAQVLPAKTFYPIAWQHYWAVLDPRRSADVPRRIEGATCLHLWNEMLRRIALDKDVLPPQGSVLRVLYESTIGLNGFAQEYALAAGCAANEFKLEIRQRNPAAKAAQAAPPMRQ